MGKYSEVQTGGQGGKYILELDGDGKPLSDESGQSEKIYVKKCANYTSKTSGKTIFGCDQYIFWKTIQGKPSKLNLDGNPHICNHSNFDREQSEKKKDQPTNSPPESKPSLPHLEGTKLQGSPIPSSIGNASNGKKPSEESQKEIRLKKGELIEISKSDLVDLYNEALIEVEKWRKIKMQIGKVLGLE